MNKLHCPALVIVAASTFCCCDRTIIKDLATSNSARLKMEYGGASGQAKPVTCLEFAASVSPEYSSEGSGTFSYKNLAIATNAKGAKSATKVMEITELVQLMQGLAFRYCEAFGNGAIEKGQANELLVNLTRGMTQVLLAREGSTLKSLVDLRTQYVKELGQNQECEKSQKKLVNDANDAIDKACDKTKKKVELAALSAEISCADGVLTDAVCTVKTGQTAPVTSPVCTFLKKKETCASPADVASKIDKLDKQLLDALGFQLVLPAVLQVKSDSTVQRSNLSLAEAQAAFDAAIKAELEAESDKTATAAALGRAQAEKKQLAESTAKDAAAAAAVIETTEHAKNAAIALAVAQKAKPATAKPAADTRVTTSKAK